MNGTGFAYCPSTAVLDSYSYVVPVVQKLIQGNAAMAGCLGVLLGWGRQGHQRGGENPNGSGRR